MFGCALYCVLYSIVEVCEGLRDLLSDYEVVLLFQSENKPFKQGQRFEDVTEMSLKDWFPKRKVLGPSSL